eukprot:8907405-Pyramimonas_sp.AAC.1
MGPSSHCCTLVRARIVQRPPNQEICRAAGTLQCACGQRLSGRPLEQHSKAPLDSQPDRRVD